MGSWASSAAVTSFAAGLGNKAIARQLDLSPRSVEVHRANIMRRAEAASIAELLRLRFLTEAITSPSLAAQMRQILIDQIAQRCPRRLGPFAQCR